MSTTLRFLAAWLVLLPAVSAQDLAVGDPAPALAVSKWVKGEPVQALNADGTYVVEFWATWCGPCRVSIPHLTKLAKHYADRVTFIGVSIWENDPAEVAPFVEKMGSKMEYSVAMDLLGEDGPGAMAETWMQPAMQRGIPSAFIVKGGKIQWIGHPMGMDETLASIVEGTWDLDEATKQFKESMAREVAIEKAQTQITMARKAGDWDRALDGIDKLIELEPASKPSMEMMRFDIQLESKRFEAAWKTGYRLMKDNWSSARTLNQIAWMIVDPDAKRASADLDLALEAAERADELTKHEDPAILDTLATVYFDMGSVERAVEVQTLAVEKAEGNARMQADLKQRLELYRAALRS